MPGVPRAGRPHREQMSLVINLGSTLRSWLDHVTGRLTGIGSVGMNVTYRNQLGGLRVRRLVAKDSFGWRAVGLNNYREDAERVTEFNLLGIVYPATANEDVRSARSVPRKLPSGGLHPLFVDLALREWWVDRDSNPEPTT